MDNRRVGRPRTKLVSTVYQNLFVRNHFGIENTFWFAIRRRRENNPNIRSNLTNSELIITTDGWLIPSVFVCLNLPVCARRRQERGDPQEDMTIWELGVFWSPLAIFLNICPGGLTDTLTPHQQSVHPPPSNISQVRTVLNWQRSRGE